eukprot:CAMPEP_0194292290 /NCGR_PEP_ID=MMETSP0169-20130528/45308_1 /TAXON_ID=218684 /ORGANISM="Corethron pennatum, Strain L29A3" /LENGTH=77 /DNA_ID=CAMNT_0039040425 /DNA_START=857 /DNA_END=1090 /DNA_ORIENTATION=+
MSQTAIIPKAPRVHISATREYYVVSTSAGTEVDWHMASSASAEVREWSGLSVYFEDILQVLYLPLRARETYVLWQMG